MAAHEFKYLVQSSQENWIKAVKALSTLEPVDQNVKGMCAIMDKDNLEVKLVINDYQSGQPKASINRILNRINRKRVPYKKKVNSKPGLACKCEDCGKTFPRSCNLQAHLKNSGQKEVCMICGNVVAKGAGMKAHLADKHKKIYVLCTDCPLLFPDKEKLKQHKIAAHKPGSLTCGDCGRTFSRVRSFESHTQMHAVRTCRACGTQFSNRGCYREHRSQCEPDAKPEMLHLFTRSKRSNIRDPATFICDYCKKVYTSRPQLKNHIIWIHMDVRPHQCQWCGKRFYTPARLAEHTVVHTRVRNFECDICGAKLVSKMAAVYHRRRHTGEKPYECPDCGERFISASRRSEHAKRRHGKGERVPCNLCPASFVRNIELKKHVAKAHSKKDKPEWNILLSRNSCKLYTK